MNLIPFIVFHSGKYHQVADRVFVLSSDRVLVMSTQHLFSVRFKRYKFVTRTIIRC